MVKMQRKRLLQVWMLMSALCVVTGEIGSQTTGADPIWRFNTGGRIRSRPAVSLNGTVYVVSEDRHLYAIHPDGSFKWRYWLKERVWDSLAIGTDGTVFTVSKQGTLFAVNSGGSELWRADVEAAPSGDPAIDTRGRVFVGTVNGGLFCFSYRGDLLWRADVPSSISGPPVLTRSGIVIVPCLNERLYAFSSWGLILWESVLAGVPVSPALSPEGIIYSGTAYGSLVALDETGAILWDYVTGSGSLNPVITDEGVFAAFENGRIALLSEAGAIRWEDELPVPLAGYVSAGENGVFYVFSKAGQLVIIGSEGTYLGGKITGLAGSYVLSRGESLIAGEDDWLVYAFPSQSEYGGHWPQSGAGQDHRGMAGRYIEKDMDQLYGSSMDYLYFKHLAQSEDVDERLAVLDEIEKRLDEQTGDQTDEYLTYIASNILSSGVLTVVSEEKRAFSDFPLARAKAAAILGKYGDLHHRLKILEVLEQEPDPTAASSEMRALGEMGSDADGKVVAAIAKRVYTDSRTSPDPSLALSAVQALEGIKLYQGDLSAPAVDLLLHIYRGKYPNSVRNAAMNLMRR